MFKILMAILNTGIDPNVMTENVVPTGPIHDLQNSHISVRSTRDSTFKVKDVIKL